MLAHDEWFSSDWDGQARCDGLQLEAGATQEVWECRSSAGRARTGARWGGPACATGGTGAAGSPSDVVVRPCMLRYSFRTAVYMFNAFDVEIAPLGGSLSCCLDAGPTRRRFFPEGAGLPGTRTGSSATRGRRGEGETSVPGHLASWPGSFTKSSRTPFSRLLKHPTSLVAGSCSRHLHYTWIAQLSAGPTFSARPSPRCPTSTPHPGPRLVLSALGAFDPPSPHHSHSAPLPHSLITNYHDRHQLQLQPHPPPPFLPHRDPHPPPACAHQARPTRPQPALVLALRAPHFGRADQDAGVRLRPAVQPNNPRPCQPRLDF